MSKTKGKRIKAVKRSGTILRKLHELGAADHGEIADELGMSKSTVYYHLQTLQEIGFVVSDDCGYRLSFEFFSIGSDIPRELSVYHTSRAQVQQIAEETGETSVFMVEEKGRGYYVNISRGDQATVQADWLGKKIHLHDNALGKAILAFYPRSKVEQILDEHGMPKTTENTVTEREELYEELDQIRERGVAFDYQEQLEGLRCVAAPITGNGDFPKPVYGAICVAGPASRMTGERFNEKVPKLVENAADVIQLNHLYTP